MNPRVILITGANGALGQAFARSFLEESPRNHIWQGVHAHQEQADHLAREFPERCRTMALDVTQPDAWKATVTAILACHQRLDVLVNNAGHHQDALLATMSPDSWRTILALNLDGVFHGCQAVLPAMIGQRHGRIINIASLSALLPPAGQANYAAAKAGVVALTRSLAKEVARIGITVNVVCPGYVDTGALPLDETERKRALERIPMRRFGQPGEVAAAVRFLACAEAGYITGSTLKIDGGIY
jgi:3-oxoacyl-[acyl-carrier protein] reductase